MADGVRGDQQLSKRLLDGKKARKPTCGGDRTKAPVPSVGRCTAQAKCKRLVGVLTCLGRTALLPHPRHGCCHRVASS